MSPTLHIICGRINGNFIEALNPNNNVTISPKLAKLRSMHDPGSDRACRKVPDATKATLVLGCSEQTHCGENVTCTNKIMWFTCHEKSNRNARECTINWVDERVTQTCLVMQ
jgi:hypothetical protein